MMLHKLVSFVYADLVVEIDHCRDAINRLSSRVIHNMRKFIISSLSFGICVMFGLTGCRQTRVIRNAGYDAIERDRGVKDLEAPDSFGLVPAGFAPLCESVGSLQTEASDHPFLADSSMFVAVQPAFLFDLAENQLKHWRYDKNKGAFGKAQLFDFDKLSSPERELFIGENAHFALLPFGAANRVLALVDDLKNGRLLLYSFAIAEENGDLEKPRQIQEWSFTGKRVLHLFQKSENELLLAVRLAGEDGGVYSEAHEQVQLIKLKWGTGESHEQVAQSVGQLRALRNVQIKGEVPDGVLVTEGSMFSGIKLYLVRKEDPLAILLYMGPLIESFASENAIYAHVLKAPTFLQDPLFGYTAVGGLWKIEAQKPQDDAPAVFTDLTWKRQSRIGYEKVFMLPKFADFLSAWASEPIGIYEQPLDAGIVDFSAANQFVQRVIGFSSDKNFQNELPSELELGSPCASTSLSPIFYLQDAGIFGISPSLEILRIASRPM